MCEGRIEGVCTLVGTDGHEIVGRGVGGSPTDPDNVKFLCRACHRFVHDFPAKAIALGLKRKSHG